MVPFGIYAKRWLGEFLAVFTIWIMVRYLYLRLVKKFPGSKNQRKRFFILPTLLIPFSLVFYFYISHVKDLFEWDVTEQFPEPLLGVRLVTGMVIFFVNIGVYETVHLFTELKDARINEEKLSKEKINSELLFLKNQMDPHFLFNSLNTLVYLIDTDVEKSKQFVHGLANIYERVLDFSDKDLISLKDELDYINAYIELLKKRYGDNLNFDFDISKNVLKKMIVPLSIQIGIENAVKHNVVSRQKPLLITVTNTADYVILSNTIQRKNTPHKGSGQALRNIKNRYKLLSDQEMIIEETAKAFKLKLPLITTKETLI